METDSNSKKPSISHIQFTHSGPPARDAHLVGRYHSAEHMGGIVIWPLLARMQPPNTYSTIYRIADFGFPDNIQINFGIKYDDVKHDEYLWLDDDHWYHVDYASKKAASVTLTKESKLKVNPIFVPEG
ncbi:hypothetical protein D9758_018752 [Tetrapyrgos nigripes]|uniref:Uncharacterized protein n=1 Tax=Tetrapyrgos nigripes TaxID=182062 RepID=A0A8H5EYX4_9AGAR|nr:hypothetical protein D9758_018752 [Tetrapyrgos nigripes]